MNLSERQKRRRRIKKTSTEGISYHYHWYNFKFPLFQAAMLNEIPTAMMGKPEHK